VRSDPAGPVFSALADPTRRQVLRHLAQDGPGTATEIAARLPVSRQAVTKHLSTLAEAGLVYGQRAGRETRYRLTPEPMAEAMTWMVAVGAEWDQRLDALRRHLERQPQ
jgi:DNA-binding transcriptional ArsR family regulator